MMLDFNNKKVLLTGHTGFKGAWMLQLLKEMGATVCGYSLEADSDSLYRQIEGDKFCQSIIADIRNREHFQKALLDFQPDFVFHMAAQALVKKGYEDPIGTYETNVMGTLNVLEALRAYPRKCVAAMITTDKVYENPENGISFSETDKLGGYDPYSSSKACDEILIHSYRRSYFSEKNYHIHQKKIVSLRAGNVIGGGDMANNRIIPDIVKAINANKAVTLRFPNAVRPWQHVLEPLLAYLFIAQLLAKDDLKISETYNIGPEKSDVLSVEEVTKIFIKNYGAGSYELEKETENHMHEANLLMLNTAKVKAETGFEPALQAEEAIEWTAKWYADTINNAADKCKQQIRNYLDLQADIINKI